MDSFEFSVEEIREQLERLGHHDVSSERLMQFKQDLEKLVAHERSKDSSGSTSLISGSLTESEEANTGQQRNTQMPSGTSWQSNNHYNYHQPTSGHLPRDYEPTTSRPVIQKNFPENLRPNASHLADTSIASSNSDKRYIKRRVARKVDGHSMISDELTESEIGDTSSLDERLGHLDLESGTARTRWGSTRTFPGHIKSCLARRPQSAEPVFRLPDEYDGPKSLIRPMSANPHTQNIRKSDPVSRYQQYSQCWQSQRAPGEKKHNSLRWNVREQMLYHDEVVQKKSKKVYVPNNYVIPSDKKRKSLRWAIRQDMAQGVVPPSVYD